MTIYEARELQKQWRDKPCSHPGIVANRETARGEWQCVRCGRLVDIGTWATSHHKGL
jgi:ribosomal protein L37AE/L43A